MRRKLIILTVVGALALVLVAGRYLNIRNAVITLPHVVVLNVASGCHLNGDPFTETWKVSNPAGVVVWSGLSETEAVQVLLNECP